jgi:hypothetical protein
MSLAINLATLAEAAATDARGNITLVAANPAALIADELPAQFSPVLLVVVEEAAAAGTDENVQTIKPGRTLSAKVEVRSPDDEIVFFAQLRQVILPPLVPSLPLRLQVIAQVPFTASKIGDYRAIAHIQVIGEHEQLHGEITATRTAMITDAASLKPRT